MATEHAQEVFAAHFGLLFESRVAQRIIVDRKLDNIVAQVTVEVPVVRVVSVQILVVLQHSVHVQRGVRVLEEGERCLQLAACALEWTLGQAIVGYERAGREIVRVELVQARRLLGRQTIVVAGYLVANRLRDAATTCGVEALQAEQYARVLCVLVAGGEHLVEERAVDQGLAQHVVVLEHGAVAVGLHVLSAKVAAHDEIGAEAGRDLNGRRRTVEGIFARVLNEHVEAAIVGRVESVRQARVQLDFKLARLARNAHRVRAVLVEAIAVQIVRVEKILQR